MNAFDRWLLRLFVAFALVSISAANQSPLFSPTVSPVSGLQLTNNFNSGLDAINTCNSGATAPTNQLSGVPSAGNCWLDTSLTPYKWKIYDGTSWNIVAFLDQVNHYWTPVVGGGPINSIASAATTDLCNATNGQPAYVSITGVVSITSFGSNCTTGQVKFGVFTGVLTLTHNAVSLILPFNGSNITTAAGDAFIAAYLGGGNWRVTSYQRATGSPSIPAPTVQRFATAGSATYTPSSGMVRIRVTMVASGAGGGAVTTNNGVNGNTSSFESWSVGGGLAGGVGTGARTGGNGGSGGANGTGTLVDRILGGNGGQGGAGAVITGTGGGACGAPPTVGKGTNTAGSDAVANSGSGGSGSASTVSNNGGGGGGGECVIFWMTAAQVGAGVSYTVAAKGAGGAAGTLKGGDGSDGKIVVEEFYF